MAIDKILGNSALDQVADSVFSAVSDSVSEIKAMQKRKAAENVQIVVQALKKIESDLQDKYDGVTTVIEKRVASIKDGKDGQNGVNGRDGKDGRPGRDGSVGPRGANGVDGRPGRDGVDGVSVTNAFIDFDGSLVINLSDGQSLNVGEVVAPDLAEKIKVITNGGGTSQGVLDTLTSLQNQINLISSALVYKGTWNASTNSPTLASGAGTANTFYIVSVAGSTTLNGISNWGVGDWATFNGTAWQRVEGGSSGNFTDLSVSGSATLSGGTANGVAYLNGSKVLTTESALAFDGKVLGVNYVGGGFAWGGSTYNALDLSVYGSVYSASTVAGVTGNAYFNGTAWSVKTSAPSTRYDQTNGTHVFFTAPTPAGLGNTTPTFTQALLLDSTGASFNGSVTLSGGTANGVAYLNGSKVLTTGSALTFDGSALTIDGGSAGYIRGPVGEMLIGQDVSGLYVGEGYSVNPAIPFFYGSTGTTYQAWKAGGTEQMRLTSTGLGIGTSSPSYKLDVSTSVNNIAGARIQNTSSASGAYSSLWLDNDSAGIKSALIKNSSTNTGNVGTNSFYMYYSDTGSSGIFNASASPITFSTNVSERMRLDASGNLGIGTSSPGAKLEVNGGDIRVFNTNPKVGVFATNSSPQINFGNAAGTTQWSLYQTTGAAGEQGSFNLYDGVAAVNRLTVSTSGNLGLGVPPSAWGTSEYKAVQVGNGASFYGRVTAGDEDKAGFSANAFNNGTNWRYIATDSASRYDQIGGGHFWYTAPSGTAGNAISFTQAMTLTAAGDLLVGTTSAIGGAIVGVAAGAVKNGVAINIDSATAGAYTGLVIDRTATNGSVCAFVRGGTAVGSIDVTTTATSYVTSSDYRLKENIAPMTGALAKVAALKPVTYTWKLDGSAGEGFIAHELAEVCPAAVTGEKDAVDADGKPQYQGIDVSFLVGTLTAAIQEQQAIITALTARVAALEAA